MIETGDNSLDVLPPGGNFPFASIKNLFFKCFVFSLFSLPLLCAIWLIVQFYAALNAALYFYIKGHILSNEKLSKSSEM